MAKSTQTQVVKGRSQAITTPSYPSPALERKMTASAGKGLSTDASDNLVPLINVLQPLNPQVMKRNEAYIEGAEAGMIWLRSSEEPLHETILFQPCFHEKYWIEYIPRAAGGGFVARYEFDKKPVAAERWTDPEAPRAIKWRMPNGNELVEHRSYSGFVLLKGGSQPYAIPLKSTGHTFGKGLMSDLNRRRLKNGNIPPLYGHVVTLGTKMRSNNAGEWHEFSLLNIDWMVDEEQYDIGEALYNSFTRGEKKTETPDDIRPEDADDEAM
jgi:hypothetical protein